LIEIAGPLIGVVEEDVAVAEDAEIDDLKNA
jgi:hypothetical protein